MKIRSMFFAAAALLAVSCSSDKTIIKGTVSEGIDSVYISVRDLQIRDAVAVVDGKFEYSCPVNEVEAGTIAVGESRLPFLLDGSPLVVESDNRGGYQLIAENSESANALVTDFYGKILPRIDHLNQQTMEWYQAGADIESEVCAKLNVEKEAILKDVKGFIEEHVSSAAIIPVLQDFGGSFEEEELAELVEKLDSSLRKNSYIQSQIRRIDAIKATREGEMFVDFTIPDSDGKEVKLSDYVGNGKYVLVDFWASWCGPCRGEIPNLIQIYNKYHGEGFDVLGIAVWDDPADSKVAAEKLGINYSEIINAQHIPTDAYGISSIPQIILFGPDGTILKRDLRGGSIEEEVAKYVQSAK